MEAMAEKIPGEGCREVGSGAMEALLPEGEVIKVPPGLAVGLWGVAHEGEDITAEASEGLREVVLAAGGLAGGTAEASDINSNLKWKVSRISQAFFHSAVIEA